MNFNKDYKEYIEYLEKTCVLQPIELTESENGAVQLFVTYLNIRYAKTHLTTDAADGEQRCSCCGSQLDENGLCPQQLNCPARC